MEIERTKETKTENEEIIDDAQRQHAAKNDLLPIFLVVFIDLLGVGIALPVLGPLLLGNSPLLSATTSVADRAIILGILIASYPLMQFFGAPILGTLSDQHGRKKLLIVSLVGTFIGYLLFGLGITLGNIYLLFLGRLIDGFTGGNISIAMSAIADISDKKSKAKNFGLIGMAFGLGFIIGPYIGGKLSDPSVLNWFNFATPFWFAAALCLLNIVMLYFRFEETLKTRKDAKVDLWMGVRNIQKAMAMEELRVIFIVVFLFNLGFSLFTQFFQVYLIERFSFTQSNIGDIWAFTGLCIAVTQGLVVRKLSDKYAPNSVLKVSILLLSIALLSLALPDKAIFFFVITPFIALANGLSQPNTTAIISNLTPKESQGEMLGVNQSVLALAYTLPGFIGGIIASYSAVGPVIAAGLIVLVAWLVFMWEFGRDKKKIETIA
ncbi:MFS transporter [Candidatus Micrarchaeota archaeon]|nr:MFS transporter [Candidatus Micrarchaeota archaeon]